MTRLIHCHPLWECGFGVINKLSTQDEAKASKFLGMEERLVSSPSLRFCRACSMGFKCRRRVWSPFQWLSPILDQHLTWQSPCKMGHRAGLHLGPDWVANHFIIPMVNGLAQMWHFHLYLDWPVEVVGPLLLDWPALYWIWISFRLTGRLCIVSIFDWLASLHYTHLWLTGRSCVVSIFDWLASPWCCIHLQLAWPAWDVTLHLWVMDWPALYWIWIHCRLTGWLCIGSILTDCCLVLYPSAAGWPALDVTLCLGYVMNCIYVDWLAYDWSIYGIYPHSIGWPRNIKP